MAKSSINIDSQCRQIISDLRAGKFSSIYLLMGDEPFYPEMVCSEIIAHCIDEYDKDFNETICYGGDITVEELVSTARRFPMMSDRQLVVVKEAQRLSDIESLVAYVKEPLDSTVLVLLLRGASLDKRKALYKEIQKKGVIVDSPLIRDYAIADWIISYYNSRSLRITPGAAQLLAEATGTNLSTIAVETDKLLKNLPEGCRDIKEEDIEKNVGISRSYSVFELTKELSFKNSAKALKIATMMGNAAKFSLAMTVSALYTHFSRILKYAALVSRGGSISADDKARALAGVNPYFYREYDTAVRNYPLPKAMQAMSLLCEYDYLSKGGDGAGTPDSSLLKELVVKLLNL